MNIGLHQYLQILVLFLVEMFKFNSIDHMFNTNFFFGLSSLTTGRAFSFQSSMTPLQLCRSNIINILTSESNYLLFPFSTKWYSTTTVTTWDRLRRMQIILTDVLQRIYRRRSRREQQLTITAYVTRMGIMGNLLPDWCLQGRPSKSMGMVKFDPQPTLNPWTDRHQIWITWLSHGHLPPRKIWGQSVEGFLPHIRENTPMATKFETK